MATIFDVAKYILSQHGAMSTMKLQKLCYYSQAWSLVWNDKPLFNEDFQAWANGPVCKDLFLKHQGEYSVDKNSKCVRNGNVNNLSADEKESIDIVLEHYGDKNAQWLSTLTHMEEPWRKARQSLPDGAPCSKVITKESMAIYYGSL